MIMILLKNQLAKEPMEMFIKRHREKQGF